MRPSKAQQYTFHTFLSADSALAVNTDERVKLWVSNPKP